MCLSQVRLHLKRRPFKKELQPESCIYVRMDFESAVVLSSNQKPFAPNAIVILGMHRSGTSALAGLTMRLGADGPATPLGATQFNPAGHFESVAFMKLHDELLRSAGTTWDDYRPLHSGWLTSPKADEFKNRLKETFDAEFGKSSLFVFKDPRNCRLMPVWNDIFTDLGVRPLFVHTHRNPLEVADSLQKRNKMDLGYGGLLWLRHILDAELGSRGSVRSFTSYDGLLADWPAEIEKIAGDLGISWPRYNENELSDLAEMIRPDLKHNDRMSSDLATSQMLPLWIKETFEIFNRWSQHGEDQNDHITLDRIRSSFNDSTAVYEGTVFPKSTRFTQERDEALAKAKTAEEKSNQQAATLETLSKERNTLSENVKTLTQERGALSKNVEILTKENSALTERVTCQQSMLDERKAEIDDALSRLNATRQMLIDAEAKEAVVVQELALAQGDLRKLRDNGDRQKKEIARAKMIVIRHQNKSEKFQAKLNQMTALVGKKDVEIQDANARTQDILSSTSWRITAPLRWAIRAFRKKSV